MTDIVDLDANAQGGLYGVTSAMLALSLISVLLRTCSILTDKDRKLGLDDFLLTTAMSLYIGECACIYWWIELGLGRHYQVVPAEKLAMIPKAVFAMSFLYDTALSFAKFTVLLFYYRVFRKSNRIFYWLLWIVGFLNLAWLIATYLSLALQCTPPRAAYEFVEGSHCVSLGKVYVSSCTISSIVDFFIVVMPVPLLLRLNASVHRRALVTLIFVCGYCVIVSSLGRLITIARIFKVLTDDSTWTYVPYMKWAQSEVALSIICGSLPNILNLGRRLHSQGAGAVFRGKATFSSSSASASQNKRNCQKIDGDAAMLRNDSIRKEETFTLETMPKDAFDSGEELRGFKIPYSGV